METRLLDLLVCPLCKGRLYPNASHTELTCRGDRLAFPVRDGVPVMLEAQARSLGAEDDASAGAQNESDIDLTPPSGNVSR
jgi:uncharacterized protein YbaR (Trm112 family)